MKITRTTNPASVTPVDSLEYYMEAKQALAEATAKMKAATKALTDQMAYDHEKTLTRRKGDKVFKFTYVQNKTTVLDEDGLKKALGAPKFNKLTTAHLDKKKLEAAMDLGTVDPVIVGQYVTEKPSAAFIRFTEGTATDDE